jgi:PhoPQ-activated pathogenicity-related protein
MKPLLSALSILLFLLPAAAAAREMVTPPVRETALDRYVAKADESYNYVHYDTDDEILYTSYFISMTSQQWRKPDEVDRVLWQHDVLISKPRNPLADTGHTAILLIDGGNNTGARPDDATLQLMGLIALATNSITAVIKQVPNQPLYFADETDKPRKEDEILAYSLDKYLVTGDEEWPVHLAMTKAAVRAMDTVQDFIARETSERVDDFIIIGGSKRGWTTWLTAAVDARVKGIVPVSIDLLNIDRQFIHHKSVYGFYTPSIKDYVAFDLPCRIQTPQGAALIDIIDPFNYRYRYTMPKLIINSTGDQFFATDSSPFYFGNLPGPKTLLYTVNTDHKQGDIENLLLNALLWMDDVLQGKTASEYTWTLEPDGSIRVQTFSQPDKVYLWQATNPNARDFRLETIGEAWTKTKLDDIGGGVYIGWAPEPATGFTAYTVEVVFEEGVVFGLLEADRKFTTDVRVTPNVLPFGGSGCAADTPSKD